VPTHVDSVGLTVLSLDLDVPNPDPTPAPARCLVSGPNLVAGYWSKPAVTAAFVHVWLQTGNVARASPEGFTYMLDPIK
jgi:long-chain acyl-CoA synthetase